MAVLITGEKELERIFDLLSSLKQEDVRRIDENGKIMLLFISNPSYPIVTGNVGVVVPISTYDRMIIGKSPHAIIQG